jgi:hypothetical protein
VGDLLPEQTAQGEDHERRTMVDLNEQEEKEWLEDLTPPKATAVLVRSASRAFSCSCAQEGYIDVETEREHPGSLCLGAAVTTVERIRKP